MLKLSPPGLVAGAGYGAYTLTSAILENGLEATAISIAKGIVDLPYELKARLNSNDPTVRGEALVDVIALGSSTAYLTQKLGMAVVNTADQAIAKAVARNAEANNAFSPIVPGGGLAAHEAAGGHLLVKHVGQSETQLLQRLANEPGISESSSFYNQASAESAISRTLDAKQAEISSWLSSSKPQMKIEYTLPENVGITIDRGMTKAVDTSNLRLILRRDSSMPTGYRIHTGFPTQ